MACPEYVREFRLKECVSFPAAFITYIYSARISVNATMPDSPALNKRSMAEATSAAQHSNNIAHALAGAGGGLLSMTLTYIVPFQLHRYWPFLTPHRYPLITLSTRAQVESKRAQSSPYDAVRHIILREGLEGVTSLYSGLDSALFGISVTNFVYYYCKYSFLYR